MMWPEEISMTVTTLGRMNVITPGTPVPLSTDPNQRVARIFAQVIPGLTGKGYLGTSNMVRATLAGVMRVLWPNSGGGFSENFLVESTDGTDSLNLSQYFVDMDVAGEGLLVTYWTE
jgi:hypothetical protein